MKKRLGRRERMWRDTYEDKWMNKWIGGYE
jgi:hypothetical protein